MGKRVNRFSQTTRDANERTLILLAGQLGAGWHEGPPLDGWIVHRGIWMPVEIKLPEREGLKNEYTRSQRLFMQFAESYNAPYWTWRTTEDVLKCLGARATAGRGA